LKLISATVHSLYNIYSMFSGMNNATFINCTFNDVQGNQYNVKMEEDGREQDSGGRRDLSAAGRPSITVDMNKLEHANPISML
jgi:hypothetical protein